MASIVLYGAAIILAILYWIYTKINFNLTYWKDKGVPELQPEFFYGDVKHAGNISMNERSLYFYNRFKKMGVKHGGTYAMSAKVWMPIDRELIKTVLIKDFQHFSAHHAVRSKTIFYDNLFHMDGEKWKDMRRKLTPTFTSGKIKMMYEIMLEKVAGLQKLIDEVVDSGKPTEIKALLARFTTDVIGSCGFGVECNSLDDINSEFFQHGQMIFEKVNQKRSRVRMFLGILGLVQPIKLDVSKIEEFFGNVVQQTLDYREKNRIIRKDFMHLMIQLKNKGIITELTNENDDVYVKTVTEEVMSFHDIASQAMLFFTAGFETSSTTMSYAFLELARNQDVQKKLRDEVREVLKRHNGKMTYDALQEMTYVDNVINETLRKYPPVTSLPRTCTKTYNVPNSNIVIDKGTHVAIPVWGLQMDPEYFPEPEKFKPERFAHENKKDIKDMTYMPFGEGPRQCLGMRFGIIQSKAGVAGLVSKYNFTLDKMTPYPPKYTKNAFMLTVDGGVWVNVTRVA